MDEHDLSSRECSRCSATFQPVPRRPDCPVCPFCWYRLRRVSRARYHLQHAIDHLVGEGMVNAAEAARAALDEIDKVVVA
jgi:hypothetical protein